MVSPVGPIYQLVLPDHTWSSSFRSHQCSLQREIFAGKHNLFLFIRANYRRIFYHSKIYCTCQQKYVLASKHILKKMRKYWPQIDMDGVMNMWILKPGNKSRGRGIVLMNKLEDVVAKVNPTGKPDTRYVVQKYIGNKNFQINN